MTESEEKARQAEIHKLRENVEKVRQFLPGDGEGLLIFGTGVVVIRDSSKNYARTPQIGEIIDEQYVRSPYVLAHEAVHLVQVITSKFGFYTAVRYAELVGTVRKNLRTGAAEEQWLPIALETYKDLNSQLEDPAAGFSALQIMEAQAVIEGF